MKLFSKSIDTKADPVAEMKAAISAAIAAARKSGVSAGTIMRHFEDMADALRPAAHFEAEKRQTSYPLMYDAETLQPINTHEQRAREEEQRIARELKAQQKAYQDALNKRTEA